MNRLLLFLVPDKQATILAGVLSALAFMLGLLDMLSRDFEAARLHLHLSVGILAALFVLKFLGMRASYRVAENARQRLHQHIRSKRLAQPAEDPRSEAVQKVQETRQMAELAGELKHALTNIAPDSPLRPKYEATLELMERIMQKGG